MPFVAHYSIGRLLGLAAIGLMFVLLGAFMVMEPRGSFDHSSKIGFIALFLGGNKDLAGHGLGLMCALMGALVIPVIVKQMAHQGPAIRVDARGVYWHRWSPKPIGWDNIADVTSRSVYRQHFVGLTLRDVTRDPPQSRFAKLGKLNRAIGFGDVSITTQGTDAKSEDLLAAIRDHAMLYAQSRSVAAQPLPEPEAPVSSRPVFGRKRS